MTPPETPDCNRDAPAKRQRLRNEGWVNEMHGIWISPDRTLIQIVFCDGSVWEGQKSSAARELVQEIIACLIVNMSRGTMTTECDAQFWNFIHAWKQGKSATGVKPPNEKGQR